MSKRREVRQMLIESGNLDLYTDENYNTALRLTNLAEKKDKMLAGYFKALDGTKEKYVHDLIVKNKAMLLAK